MENKTLDKVLDVAGSAAKVMANMSETQKKLPIGDSDNSNNASTGSQNIQIHMDSGRKSKETKPVEKHIHTFPEQRALTTEECELDLKKAQMEYDYKLVQEKYFQKVDEREWLHKLEVEKKNERKRKIRNIIFGVFAAVGVGAFGYSCYCDYRGNKAATGSPKALPQTSTVKSEGKVE